MAYLSKFLEAARQVWSEGTGCCVQILPHTASVAHVCHKLLWPAHLARLFGLDSGQHFLKNVLALGCDLRDLRAGQTNVIEYFHLNVLGDLALGGGHLWNQNSCVEGILQSTILMTAGVDLDSVFLSPQNIITSMRIVQNKNISEATGGGKERRGQLPWTQL